MRDDVSLAQRQQLAHKLVASLSALAFQIVPGELRGGESGLIERIGDVVAESLISLFEFSPPSLAHGLREVALEIAEKRKQSCCAPFFAHEQHWRQRREQGDRQRGFYRSRRRRKPVAERAVADLVMVLNEVDECGG